MHATLHVRRPADDGLRPSAEYAGADGLRGFRCRWHTVIVAGGGRVKALGGRQVTMPFAATFWAKGFGMLVDRFGVSWMVNCE